MPGTMRVLMAAAMLGIAGAGAGPATHAFAATDGELVCEARTAKAMGKLTVSRARCLTACNQGARNGTTPLGDCLAGAYQGATAACADLAESKAAAAEVGGCRECPACYDGDGACAPGDCACDAPDLAEEVAAAIDLYGGAVYCDDSASPDGLTDVEAHCQDVATRALGKFVVSRLTCFRRCHANEHKGAIPSGACATHTDAATTTCLAAASSKAAAAIDKVCEPLGGNRPECYLLDGNGWASLIGGVVDGYDGQFFCAP